MKNDHKAALYAAFKILERELKKDGELPPGYHKDLSHTTITITFPSNTIVERDGTNNGKILKKATQNLYGYTFFTIMIRKLKKFNQWNQIRTIILETVTEALRNNISARSEIKAEDPELAAEIDKLQQEFPIPMRTEDTPRICKDTKVPATITITMK